jgi:hypothetical protein
VSTRYEHARRSGCEQGARLAARAATEAIDDPLVSQSAARAVDDPLASQTPAIDQVARVSHAKRAILLRAYRHLLYRSGIRPLAEIVKDNPLAQDYVRWGLPGPGSWVSIYSTAAPTPHVFMTIAGIRLDTSHNGTDEGPNRLEDGPRWRLFKSIPSWAHWSVRHPPGL